jgi:hypothetical protein
MPCLFNCVTLWVSVLPGCPLRVIFDQIIELSLRADVRFDPKSDRDNAATQYVAMG